MKPLTAILIFLSLLIPSLSISYSNYETAKEYIIEDMNQALAKTILSKTPEKVTADTLNTFWSNLKIDELKEISYLSICTDEPSKVSFCSDTMSYKCGVEKYHMRAYPNCTKAAIFDISEQTLPGLLFIISLLWGMFSMVYLHQKERAELFVDSNSQTITFGNLSFSASSSLFYNETQEKINFTPMQLSFMKMLITSEYKRVSVDEICNTLWPGKDNARESLYTLVRRLKPVVEKNSNIRIVSDKSGYYTLTIENT